MRVEARPHRDPPQLLTAVVAQRDEALAGLEVARDRLGLGGLVVAGLDAAPGGRRRPGCGGGGRPGESPNPPPPPPPGRPPPGGGGSAAAPAAPRRAGRAA